MQRAKHISPFKHMIETNNITIGFWGLLLPLSFSWSTRPTPSPNKSLSLRLPGMLKLCPLTLVFPGILLNHHPSSAWRSDPVWHLSELASLLLGCCLFWLDDHLHGFLCNTSNIKVAPKERGGSAMWYCRLTRNSQPANSLRFCWHKLLLSQAFHPLYEQLILHTSEVSLTFDPIKCHHVWPYHSSWWWSLWGFIPSFLFLNRMERNFVYTGFTGGSRKNNAMSAAAGL